MGTVRDFLLPDLGEGLTEGEILEWRVEAGDQIDLNQTVCVVETAKAAVEIPSPFAGTVIERIGDIGESLEVGSPLLRIDVEEIAGDVELAEITAPPGEAAGGRDGESEVPDTLHGEIASRTLLDAGEEQAPQPLVGYGEGRAGARRRRRHGRDVPANGDGHAAAQRPLAKPPVRKLAKDLGIDLAAIAPGSGPQGIITRDDVRRAAGEVEAPPAAAAPRPAPPPRPAEAPPGFRGRRPGEVIPVRAVRRRIAERVATSRRRIPHAAAEQWADCTALWELRGRLSEQAAAEGADVHITPFVLLLRAAVLALRRFPTLNATFVEDAGNGQGAEIHLHEAVHLGVATDTDRGLIVPVVRDADTLSVLDLAREVARLVRGARDGTVEPGDLVGSTFSVTNYGALGNDDGDPVINHPEGAILGVGAMRERPWVVDGQVTVRRVAKLKTVFDHRICDGGEAGRFVAHLARLCEDPGRMLLHA